MEGGTWLRERERVGVHCKEGGQGGCTGKEEGEGPQLLQINPSDSIKRGSLFAWHVLIMISLLE